MSHCISNYEPEYLFSRGGFGVVIESKNLIDEKEYAVKIIKLPNKEDEKDKILREVKHMTQLEHQNIVNYLFHEKFRKCFVFKFKNYVEF